MICVAELNKNTFGQGCKDQLLDGHCPLEIMNGKCPGGQAPCDGWGLVQEVGGVGPTSTAWLNLQIYKEDKHHVLGGGLSMKWEGRGPLQFIIVVYEVV